MTPLLLFLLACVTVFLGCIEAAFSTLMRLSLRLMAERGGRGDRLGRYLDDPLELFIPLRLLIATAVRLSALGAVLMPALKWLTDHAAAGAIGVAVTAAIALLASLFGLTIPGL